MSERPNILFIFTDDQRHDTIGALGNPAIRTPHLDRLVNDGTTFTHAHIMGGTSGAVCMPSRAMLLTGRTLFSLEGTGRRIPPEHRALPEAFRAAGYDTFHTGKWHQDRESHHRCFSCGATISGFNKAGGWYEMCNGHWHMPVHDFDPSGDYPLDAGYNCPPVEPFEAPFETVKEGGRHSSEVFADSAVEFLRGRSERQNPFFAYVAFTAPHDPRQYPARFRDMYRAEDIELPPNFATRHPFDNGELLIRDELLEAHPRRPAAVRQHIADYCAIISHLDEQVGRILAALDESGLAENTLVVFSSDNGLAVGQHGLMGKQNLYEHSVRVPLIFRGLGIAAGRRTAALCYLLDIFPTLCERADLAVPDSVEGRSLAPLLADPDARIRDELHLAYKGVQRGLRTDRHKLIEYAAADGRHTQLFDLDDDPWETRDLSSDAAHAGLLADLRGRLGSWRNDLGDTNDMGRTFWEEYDDYVKGETS